MLELFGFKSKLSNIHLSISNRNIGLIAAFSSQSQMPKVAGEFDS